MEGLLPFVNIMGPLHVSHSSHSPRNFQEFQDYRNTFFIIIIIFKGNFAILYPQEGLCLFESCNYCIISSPIIIGCFLLLGSLASRIIALCTQFANKLLLASPDSSYLCCEYFNCDSKVLLSEVETILRTLRFIFSHTHSGLFNSG